VATGSGKWQVAGVEQEVAKGWRRKDKTKANC